MVRIENWSVVADNSPESAYIPPEHRKSRLHGEVYGHPRFEDGKRVVTSSIYSSCGRMVRTRSGTMYELGNPEFEYEQFCAGIGKPIDPLHPIKVIEL